MFPHLRKKACCAAVLGLTWFAMSAGKTQAQPATIYLDPGQPLDKRVADLIGRMTIEEKALSLFHNAPGIERLKIPAWGGWNQCLHGVWSKKNTTLYPVSIALAATWNPKLVHSVADAIADEGRALYNIGASGPRGKHGLVYRAPVINISRDPRWGRIQECYGEDPFLCSKIAVAYVKGLQGDHPKYLKVATTLKHFAINNQETGRFSFIAQVPERMMHEYWLPHFKACVVEGKTTSLMAAYNGINDDPCAVNKLLLTDILRGQWGFDGFVVSDLGGIGHLLKSHRITAVKEEAVARALLAGCDYDDEEFRDAIPGAFRKGLVSEQVVDQALTRVLKVAFRLGVFDPQENVPFTKTPAEVIESPKHRELSLQSARASIVLLKNDNAFLPLDKGKLKKVAVIGPAAEQPTYGNYFGVTSRRINPLEGLKNKLGKNVEVLFAKGCDYVLADKAGELDAAVKAAKEADVVLLFLGTNGAIEAEGRDRKDIVLPQPQQQLLEAIVKANPKTALMLLSAGPLAVQWAKDHVPAILQAWYPGSEGGTAIAEVLLGDFNPGGRLPWTMYQSLQQIPPLTEYDITKGFTYLYFGGTPVYTFGHGLSYTRFAYDGLALSAASMPANGQLEVNVVIRNSGDRPGDEVAQLYVREENPSVKRPLKELRGFQRVHLQPGQEKRLTFVLPAAELAFYDVAAKGFRVQPGMFEIMVGSSSSEIKVRDRVQVTGK